MNGPVPAPSAQVLKWERHWAKPWLTQGRCAVCVEFGGYLILSRGPAYPDWNSLESTEMCLYFLFTELHDQAVTFTNVENLVLPIVLTFSVMVSRFLRDGYVAKSRSFSPPCPVGYGAGISKVRVLEGVGRVGKWTPVQERLGGCLCPTAAFHSAGRHGPASFLSTFAVDGRLCHGLRRPEAPLWPLSCQPKSSGIYQPFRNISPPAMDLKVFKMLWGNDHRAAPFPIAGGVVGDVFLEEPHPLPRLHRAEQKACASAPHRPWPTSADCRVCCWDQAPGEECGDGGQDSTPSHREATQWRLLLFSLSPPALGWETVSSVLLLKVQDCGREGRYSSIWIHTLFPSSRKSGYQKRKRQLNWRVLVETTLTYSCCELFISVITSSREAAYPVTLSYLSCGLWVNVMPSFLPVWLLMFKASFRNLKSLSTLWYLAFQDHFVSAATLKQPHSTTRLTSLVHSVSVVILGTVLRKPLPRDGRRKADIDAFVLFSF